MLGELIGSVELAEGRLTASAHEVMNNFNHPIEEQDAGSRACSLGSGRSLEDPAGECCRLARYDGSFRRP
jgi:hypothetical protein